MVSSPGIHPGELSRRISELEITTLARSSTNEPASSSHHTAEEHTSLVANQENRNNSAVDDRGILTPPEVPAPPPSPHNDPGTSDGALADIDTNAKSLDGEHAKKKKKKKSGKNKKPSPTGFEEFYADPPLTVGEFEEEQGLYNSSVPFHDRIQTAIQRYRKRRSLDNIRSSIFTKYLMLGGIEGSTTKPFTGGLDQDVLDSATAQEIADIQATDFIRSGHNNSKYYDPDDPEDWTVDFEGIAKGFFSSTAFKYFTLNNEQGIKNLTGVVRNFLNYLLRHIVCPEYTSDIMAARLICDLAEEELMAMENLRGKLPGPFNLAVSQLYGNMSTVENSEGSEVDSDDDTKCPKEKLQAPPARLERIIKTGVAFEGTDKMFSVLNAGHVQVVQITGKRFIEVIRIDRATQDTIKKYSVLEDHDGNLGNLLPLGKAYVKHWEGPGHFAEDLTDEEEESLVPCSEPRIETLWIEDHILEHFFPGMKLEVQTSELNIGLTFLEEVYGFFCSFYTLLPNEKMLDNWKEPVANTRPAPTEDDPDAEEETKDAELN